MKAFAIALTVASFLLAGRMAAAQECRGAPDYCAACGCHAACQKKVCQVVCEIKKVQKTCWCVEYEEFCAPRPGCGLLEGLLGGSGCDRCGGNPCASSSASAPCAVAPKCGPVRLRKKLVKKEYECEEPVYQCVVKYLCSDCSRGADGVPTTEPTQAPAPPAPAPDQQAFGPAPLPPLSLTR